MSEQDAKLDAMIADSDTGGRNPTSLFSKKLLIIIPFTWSLFQLWYASPLPFIFNIWVLNDTEARAIHLAFAIFLAFTAYPSFKSSPRDTIPLQDWIAALVGAFCAGYIYLFYVELSSRPGLPTTFDIVIGVVGIALLAESTRRTLGPPLMIVAAIFLIYTFGGQYMPDVIAHKGASLNKGISHFWLTTEGVFGVALGVSTSMVFMFVLFGSMLEKAGAGNYFIRMAFSLIGHMRGGPAKAAVVASAMTGLVSGSSIANVVTTGTFTIPLMKQVGFSAEKAGAVEVASSTNGQLTPPIMGAAAFLMIEYVGISYIEVIKHAFLPAIISYIALVYIVHLEALKADMKGLPRLHPSTFIQSLISFLTTIIIIMVLSAFTYYGLSWIKVFAGDATPYVAGAIGVIAYVALVKYSTTVPDLETTTKIDVLPETRPTVISGLYFLLPIVVLVWCLTVERLSPGLSAFWASVFMMFVVVTHKPLKVFFRGDMSDMNQMIAARKESINDFVDGMLAGARNMIGIGVATAAAGIIVGTVTITGIGLVMTEFVEFISGGNVLVMLIFTAVISLILGMGLPTTANYIVVSTLMAPVIVSLGAENGLIVPLIAVHLFVFYFGILADDTPPVGLAAYAAAAISKGDPIKTGIQGFAYDIRTAILPFMFIFNTEILMIGINSVGHFLLVVTSSILAMLTFAAATQGYFIVRCKVWEILALLLITFTIFRPGYFWDQVYPPFEGTAGTQIINVIEQTPLKGMLRVDIAGETLEGKQVSKTVMLQLGEEETAQQRLQGLGLELENQQGKMIITNMVFGSPAEKAGMDFDWEIISLQIETERPAKQFMYIPALILLFIVYGVQRKRRSESEVVA